MRLKVENRVIVALAGPVAQRTFRASSVRRHHGPSDHQGAIDLLSYFAGSSRQLEAYFKWLRVRTEDFVHSPVWWTQIDAIAAALLVHKRLSIVDAKNIARDALGWPVPKALKNPPTRRQGCWTRIRLLTGF
jgi:hypothetical protein